MANTLTKAANAHTTVVTGWSTPTAAYSTTNDSTYATLVCPKQSTNSGDFGFPAFTTAEIPAHSTLTSVVFFTTYGITAAVTGALVGEQGRRNSTGVTLGSEITRSTASMADANATMTGATLTDLRTANELRVRARATKGNTSTASTAQIDRLYLTVTWTEVVSAAAGTITGSATMSAGGTKKTAGAGGSLASTATLTPGGAKKTGGAGGSLSSTATMSMAGTKWEPETHSGGGTLTGSATFSLAATKATGGAGGSLASSATFLSDGGRSTSGASGAISASPTLTAGGTKATSGAGTDSETLSYGFGGTKATDGGDAIAATATLAATGSNTTPIEEHSGGGTLDTSASLSSGGRKGARAAVGSLASVGTLEGDGGKRGQGAGVLTLAATMAATGAASSEIGLVFVLAATGTKTAYGTGTLALTARLVSGKPYAPAQFRGGRSNLTWKRIREEREGFGLLELTVGMSATGEKTFESDDELVMVLAA